MTSSGRRSIDREIDTFSVESRGASDHRHTSLPTDGGKVAWMVLASCCLVQAPAWGYPVSFGVIQQYLKDANFFRSGGGSVATIGTTLSGIMYISSPFLFTALTAWPRLRRYVMPLGLVLTLIGFLASSFAKEIYQLVILQGVIAGIGSSLLFTGCTLNLDEWWVNRKGLAYGIMLSAKAMTGAACPLIFDLLLRKFGFKTVIQAWTIAILAFSIPSYFLTRPRLPLSRMSRSRPLSWHFLKLPSFWLLQTGNFVQAIGYMMPQTYLPSYATTLHLNSLTGTLILALFSLSSVFGAIAQGLSNDRYRVSTCLCITSIGSVVSVLLFWGFASHVALLAIFAATYGFFAGGYSSTWGGVLKEIRAQDEGVETGLIFGLLSGGRGLGFAISGPLSTLLLDSSWGQTKAGGYGTQYGPMIVFTGVSALLGGWGVCNRWLQRA